jgi:uncharacterized protein (TIGR01777 family)
VPWDPEASDGLSFADSQGDIAGAEAVVNLAGASIAGGRWTTQRKMVLRSSRVKTTRSLVAALGRLKTPPKVLLSASAVGYYGNRGDEVLTEESKAGDDFLAQLAREWEAEAMKAETAGMRVVRARFGIILAKHGGALPSMMRLFQFFVGGKIGSGRQWMSWITLEDVIGILVYALKDGSVSGAIDVVAPQPVRNVEFTRELARALHPCPSLRATSRPRPRNGRHDAADQPTRRARAPPSTGLSLCPRRPDRGARTCFVTWLDHLQRARQCALLQQRQG